VESNFFENFIIVVIIFNAVGLSLSWVGIQSNIEAISDFINLICVVIFIMEFILKIFAYRHFYFLKTSDLFDFIVVFLSLIVIDESWLVALKVNVSALRIIRVMRLFRLIKVNEDLRNLLKTIIMSLPNIFTTALLLLLLLFTFSIVGMSLLGE
jgi:hypothetical protein